MFFSGLASATKHSWQAGALLAFWQMDVVLDPVFARKTDINRLNGVRNASTQNDNSRSPRNVNIIDISATLSTFS